jgi:hypothetical protein
MIGEFNVFGVFVPGFLVYAVLAFVALGLVRPVLELIGAYRLVWHQPLVDYSLLVIFMALIAAYLPGYLS